MDPDIERPAKRVRQACEPCRRKKSKCSGEQPICSTCARLRQGCVYAGDPAPTSQVQQHSPEASPLIPDTSFRSPGQEQSFPNTTLQDRIQSIEDTLKTVVQTLQSQSREAPDQGVSPASLYHRQADRGASLEVSRSGIDAQHEFPMPLTNDTLRSIARAYLRHCECQPLPLFDPDSFIDALPTRDPEVLHSVVASAQRFSLHVQVQGEDSRDAAVHERIAYRLVMQRVTEGGVELSTLQALCILSLLKFDAECLDGSRMLCALAASLAQSAQLDQDPQIPTSEVVKEERRRCYWAIVLLCRMFGQPEQLTSYHKSLTTAAPRSASAPPSPIRRAGEDGNALASSEPKLTKGIMNFVLELSETWPAAMAYVRACRIPSDRPTLPWSPNSEYTRMMGSLMDLGHTVPLIHRYRSIKFSDVSSELLEQSSMYWCPWFMSRFIYHGLICLLNHPLLLTLQVRSAQNVADAFLHKTSCAISNHVSWVMHYIDFMYSRQFFLSDPLTVYSVAVVATIELQRSFFKDKDVCERSRHNFESCVKFIDMVASKWAYASRMSSKLRALAVNIAAWSQPTPIRAEEGISTDVSAIFEILDFPSSLPTSTNAIQRDSVFGSGLGQAISSSDRTRVSYTRIPRILPIDRELLHNPSPISNVSDQYGNSRPRIPEDDLIPSMNQFMFNAFQDSNFWLDDFGTLESMSGL